MRLTLTTDDGEVIDEWHVSYDVPVEQRADDEIDTSRGMARAMLTSEIHESIESHALVMKDAEAQL